MKYSLALEDHVRIARGYYEAEHKGAAITDLVREVYRSGHGEMSEDLVTTLVDVVLRPLMSGETIFWTSQMCDLLKHSAESLPDWTCESSMPIIPCGFSMLEKPIRVGMRANIVALGWSRLNDKQGRSGLGLVCFSQERAGDALMPYAFSSMPDGERLKRGEGSFDKFSLFGAAFILLSQRILIAPQQRAERGTRRRLEREGFTHEPLVRVVELRRKQAKSEHGGDSEAVDWSHQWIVSGHWRQQWYPSLNAYQPRWIMPYVKGPEDKPLKPPRAKVFAVVR